MKPLMPNSPGMVTRAHDADLPLAICLSGPTGSGKTGLALVIAKELGCEIVNADSRQVYVDFPIITAQPGASEQRGAPHHLYGFLETAKKISAGQWAQIAREKCREIMARGRLPLVVGGTGFYFAALLEGLADIPSVAPEISANFSMRMVSEGPARLYVELCECDPDYALKLHPSDRQRIQRALEVRAATGRPLSWWHRNSGRKPFCRGPLLTLDAPLGWLEPRIAARIGQMVELGAVEEARLAAMRSPTGPGWSGIGCNELGAYLAGKLSFAECRSLWLKNTRAYAKRQLTWFRSRKDALWIAPDAPEAIIRAIQNWLRAIGFY